MRRALSRYAYPIDHHVDFSLRRQFDGLSIRQRDLNKVISKIGEVCGVEICMSTAVNKPGGPEFTWEPIVSLGSKLA